MAAKIETIKIDKTKLKRLSKSQRLHVRRMKQEAKNTGVVYKPQII